MATIGIILSTALFVASANAALDATQLWNPNGFIRVQGLTFVDDDCKEWLPNGWNTWNQPLLTIAIEAAKHPGGSEELRVLSLFSEGAQNGFNVMRMFLTPVDESQAMMSSPGQYNEDIWRGVDFLLDAARQFYVKLILVWVNNWQLWEGPAWWLDPTSQNLGAVNQDAFWSDRGTRERLYNHMFWVVNRRNTFNNIIYKEDPTIFAWNLYNEMRCPASQVQNTETLSACLRDVQQWIDETSTYLKLIDPNHLVTFGEEGFFGRESDLEEFNPSGTPSNVEPGWAAWVGQDFISQHSPANIDFLSFHLWPDNWQTFSLDWTEKWIAAHITAANNLSKPLILQEFGKRSDKERAADIRDPYYQTVYKAVSQSLQDQQLLKGSLFWYWDPLNAVNNRANANTVNGQFPPSAAVVHSDGTDPTTWRLIAEHSEAQYVLQQREVPECTRLGDIQDYLTTTSTPTVAGR